jgi:hypothetical protein
MIVGSSSKWRRFGVLGSVSDKGRVGGRDCESNSFEANQSSLQRARISLSGKPLVKKTGKSERHGCDGRRRAELYGADG